jgi:orotate phosphoribosyltransferase
MRKSNSNKTIADVIEDASLLWHGHFALASGEHSDTYWMKFRLLEQPQILARLCEPIVHHFKDSAVDLVVGPTLGGVPVAYEVARQMGTRALFAERRGSEGTRFVRQPTTLTPGQRVLLVDDVFMTGWTIRHIVQCVLDVGATVCGIGIILDRSKQLRAYPNRLTRRLCYRLPMP